MARIFEKTLFFKAKRPWDKKAKLLEVYKLQSNNLGNKCKAEVHNSSGASGVKFTLDSMIRDFNIGLDALNLSYGQSFAEFGKCLQGRSSSDWEQVLNDHFLETASSVDSILA
jgi:hypothetical protein